MSAIKGLILVIEDDYDVAEMLTVYFGYQGYEVVHSNTGTEGLSKAQQLLPDLIILDIMLPDILGYEVLQTLRSTPLTKNVSIIILSQRDERNDILKGLEYGADDYVTKPFDIEGLKFRVEARLHLHQLKQRKIDEANLHASPIFVSYSRTDWDTFVNPLIRRLEAEKLSFWVDQTSIEGSSDWLDEINKALKLAQRMVVCVSPEALQSRYVKMEYRYAFNNGIRLYPIVCRATELPAELQVLQFFTYSELDKLISALKK